MGNNEEFNDGARYVLEYLYDLFEGIADTDIWSEFMENED